MPSSRRLLAVVAALGILGLTAAVAIAGNAHFVGTPTCTQDQAGTANATVTCSGKIAGLGSEKTVVTVTANGTTICTNRGENNPPGQTRTSGSQVFPRVRNGQITFSVTTQPARRQCPDKMRASTTFTSATILVEQPPGTVVLEQTFPL
jgi:hypothetical protein